MSFTGVNYVAVIIAALAGFGLGAIWYTVLSKPWMHAVGKTEADQAARLGQSRALRHLPSSRSSSWP